MSDSRLEKFIYAICSMDVSDLPVPLSRIEKLWNCLITGETPDFEPLSRNEKYLMAMLDRYDISNLPAPMSRGEKLLYKIAMGETDLSDVPGYLSQYEELLKYLIENGGISGGDFEYVLYTLNQSLNTLYTTAEKPVKSAILSGQTLVNLASKKTTTLAPSSNDIISNDLIKSKTTYTIAINVYALNESSKIRIRNALHDGSYSPPILDVNIILGKNIFTVTTVDNAKNLMINYHNSFGKSEVVIDDIVIIEGNHANIDIPYFTGMQSVKMPVLTTSNEDGTKTNILTVNEEVELRGIGEVQDELNLLTGELTERIGEIVLNGSENWSRQGVSQNNSDLGVYYSTNALPNTIFNTNNVLCDKFKTSKTKAWHSSEEDIYVSVSTYGLKICFDERKLKSTTVEGFKKWLSENTPTIQYPLVEKPIKTVDLTVVDQDNQPTKLGTFENVTHVLLESAGLIPEVAMEVATHISTALASASPLMDDISTKQEQLNTTVDEQSENVDATMIATTEIYEETL